MTNMVNNIGEKRKKLIIIDDVELNCVILREAFNKEYDILEAGDGSIGLELILQYRNELAAIFLDIIMPEMDGFTVLQELEYNNIIKTIPLFLITTEATDYVVEKAYDYGAIDVIPKPFNLVVISRRVRNVIELFETRRRIEGLYNQQKEKIREHGMRIQENSWDIINALNSAIETRSDETGVHTNRVQHITEYIARMLAAKHPEYSLSEEKIRAISKASTLHDCGKIAVPDHILNKPASAGRLTPEEYNEMKKHTVAGYNLIHSITGLDEPLYTYSMEICRSHHERWDGNGYPDGLIGNQIPLSAQIVSIADVFDALLSPRVYKDAYTYEQSIKMINNGDCGVFNPALLSCFNEISEELYKQFYRTPANA